MDVHFSTSTHQQFNPFQSSNSFQCRHCHNLPRQGKTKSQTRKHHKQRIFCQVLGCKASFGRPSDLARHGRSIHGPKQRCAVQGCGYASARRDKMVEHVRNRHKEKNTPSTSNLSRTLCSTEEIEATALFESMEYLMWDHLLGDESCFQELLSPPDIVPYGTEVVTGNSHSCPEFGFNEILTKWPYDVQSFQ